MVKSVIEGNFEYLFPYSVSFVSNTEKYLSCVSSLSLCSFSVLLLIQTRSLRLSHRKVHTSAEQTQRNTARH